VQGNDEDDEAEDVRDDDEDAGNGN